MNLILILSCSFNIQGKELYWYDFVKKSLHVGLYSYIYGPISFKLGVMIMTTKFYVLIAVWMTLTFIQGQRLYKKSLVSIFSQI